MARSINYLVRLLRAPQGVLAPYIVPFARALRDEGFQPVSVARRVSLASDFSRWLASRNVGLPGVGEPHCLRYLRCRSRRVLLSKCDEATLRGLLRFLRASEAISPAPDPRPRRVCGVDRCVGSFARYLEDQRGLAQVTIVDYCIYVRRFLLALFGRRQVRLSALSAQHIMKYVQRRAARASREQARHLITALRAFLRYARYRAEIVPDLQGAVLSVAQWSRNPIPRAMPDELLRQLLQHCDRSTAMGLRDYAILLLLARLGLRSGEIVRLELDDIDWQTGSLCVHGKGTTGQLPLPDDAGKALAAYLRHGRPHCLSRRVFLRAVAPVAPFRGSPAIGSIIRHRLRHAGIELPNKGTHQFRHALATQMLRRGASLTEIGQVLRHRSPQTTQVYAKVDLVSLRTLALAWPGDAP